MKILHFSDEPLPDIRIERYAHLQSKMGHEIHFCGGPVNQQWFTGHFTKYHLLPATPAVRLGLPSAFPKYRHQFHRLFNQIKPDVVHTHNLATAKVCIDLEIPFIYDDHEYWSKQVLARNVTKVSFFSKRKITNRIAAQRVRDWEPNVLETAIATITVAETIAEEHQKFTKNVFTIPNFPTTFESQQISNLQQKLDSVQTILITKTPDPIEERTVEKYMQAVSNSPFKLTVIGRTGRALPQINYKGFIPHMELIQLLPHFHLGLLTLPADKWSTGYFRYYSPNRIFLYGHAGVTPVIHEDMTFLRKIFGKHALTIKKEDDIVEVMQDTFDNRDLFSNRPANVQTFAQEHLVFEKGLPVMNKVYQLAQF